MHLGFLHTSQVHVDTFESLVDERVGERSVDRTHLVDPELLQDAIDLGVEAVAGRLEARLRTLVDEVEVVICTCSTLGGAAERIGGSMGRTVVRVDRPMVVAALALGSHLGVAHAVTSTIEPTTALITDVADGRPFEITSIDCTGAWPAFLDGDLARYHAAVAAAVDASADGLDAVVLAQASMAGAAGLVSTSVPVLSSPAAAVDAVLSGTGLSGAGSSGSGR